MRERFRNVEQEEKELLTIWCVLSMHCLFSILASNLIYSDLIIQI